jgi:nucleoside-diphosphate-sugar epimerase
MRIFLTGATGFIGSHIIPHLLGAGHQVIGLTRTETGAENLRRAGVEPYRGVLEEPEALAKGAENADAVIHCAFDHDFSNYLANCEKERRVVEALGDVLRGSNRALIVSSGAATGAKEPGQVATEDVFNLEGPNPRVISEVTAAKFLDQGVKVIAMRLPQVHDTQKQGLITPMILMAKAQGRSAYIGEGANRLAAAHISDVALLYRLAVEQGQAGERFHAVDEEGVSALAIATAIGKGLGVPVVSLTPERAAEHFGHFAMFAMLDMPASSVWTRQRLDWTPTGPSLIADLDAMNYAALG